jgi:hypothetical protein
MAKRRDGVASRRQSDHFEIVSGALGSVPRCELEIRPLTLFIGPQGVGKSLVAQVLYAFEELPFLMYAATVERGSARKSTIDVFRWLLDRLRSSERAFATFANPKVNIRWTRSQPYDEWPSDAPPSLNVRAYSVNRQVAAPSATLAFLEKLRARVTKPRNPLILHHAIFFPTERMTISQLRSAMGAQVLALPITYTLFSHWLEDHAAPAIAAWPRGQPDSADGKRVDELGRMALGGSTRKLGAQWKWEFGPGRGRGQFDLDMASSGQRANWSLPYLARTLFTLRSTGDIANELTLFVEEPEIHLHPAAQKAMVEILALMVNRGFRVVVTTHSLVVLYVLNNLLQASRLGTGPAADVPAPDLRLRPQDVSVYAFAAGKAPRQLVDQENAFIDESELGAVSEELAAELNRVTACLPEREG